MQLFSVEKAAECWPALFQMQVITSIDYATRLWQVFRAVIAGALDELPILPGDRAAQVMKAIDHHVQSFFVQALQLDVATLRLEAR